MTIFFYFFFLFFFSFSLSLIYYYLLFHSLFYSFFLVFSFFFFVPLKPPKKCSNKLLHSSRRLPWVLGGAPFLLVSWIFLWSYPSFLGDSSFFLFLYYLIVMWIVTTSLTCIVTPYTALFQVCFFSLFFFFSFISLSLFSFWIFPFVFVFFFLRTLLQHITFEPKWLGFRFLFILCGPPLFLVHSFLFALKSLIKTLFEGDMFFLRFSSRLGNDRLYSLSLSR